MEGEGHVRAIADARTLVLADGRRLLLAAIDVPQMFAAPARADLTAPAGRAEAALAPLVGRVVAFKGSGATDRHGRLPVFVFSRQTGLEGSLQQDMVAQGLARVASFASGSGCAADLLAREREARAALRGLWADSRYAVRQADDPTSILPLRGRMAIVEGRVLSVRERGGTIYVNFGRRWSEDFTVTIAKRRSAAFAAGGMPPQQLSGRRVRVRGWVEDRAGPWIEVISPEQIEFVTPLGTQAVR